MNQLRETGVIPVPPVDRQHSSIRASHGWWDRAPLGAWSVVSGAPLVPHGAEPVLLARNRWVLRGRGRQCRSPGPPRGALPPASGTHLVLGPGAWDLLCWERKHPGAAWGFPRESWDLGIFCPPLFSPPSSSSGSCSHAGPGVTNGFKKSNSPHNALPFPHGCW